jgi:CheY-like chemotaxis protein
VIRRTAKILVVDDDLDVLELAVAVLEMGGFEPMPAAAPATALAALEGDGEIELLFTDIVMPGMNGFELAEAARRLRPGLPILYTTGYAKELVADGTRLGPLLPKPWRPERLVSEVRAALGG